MKTEIFLAIILTSRGPNGAGAFTEPTEPPPSGRLSEEKRLYKHLLSDYDTRALPVNGKNLPINVTIGLTLHQILEIDTERQVAKLNAWLQFGWRDESLSWDASAFGGVEKALIPPSQLWTPDIGMLNGASFSASPVNAMVDPTGDVHWIPPALITVPASMDTARFPFDKVELVLKLGSWGRSGLAMNLTLGNVETASCDASPQWQLLSSIAKRNVVHYTCCEEPFLDVTIRLRLRRRSGQFVLTRLAPCVALAGLALLALSPPLETRGPALGSLFLALLLASGWAASGLPHSGADPPRAVLFLLSLLGSVAAAALLSIVEAGWGEKVQGALGRRWLSMLCHTLCCVALIVATAVFFLTTPDYAD